MTFWSMTVDLLSGLAVSAEIFVFTLLLSLPLGFPIALGRMSGNRLVAGVFRIWISIVRGTPLMLQIIFVYFAPYIFFKMPLSRYPRLLATVLAFGFNYAAYFAEIYRGGILSIDVGQHEAAKAFFRIILPQTVKRVIPAVGNEVITLVKDTSLAFTIAVTEMFTIAKQLSSANTSMTPLIAAGVFYYMFNYLVAFGMERLEKRFSYYS